MIMRHQAYCPWNWDHLLASAMECSTSWDSYFMPQGGEERLSPVGPMETLVYVDWHMHHRREEGWRVPC